MLLFRCFFSIRFLVYKHLNTRPYVFTWNFAFPHTIFTRKPIITYTTCFCVFGFPFSDGYMSAKLWYCIWNWCNLVYKQKLCHFFFIFFFVVCLDYIMYTLFCVPLKNFTFFSSLHTQHKYYMHYVFCFLLMEIRFCLVFFDIHSVDT